MKAMPVESGRFASKAEECFEATGGCAHTHYGEEFVQGGTRAGQRSTSRDSRTALALRAERFFKRDTPHHPETRTDKRKR